MNYLPLNINVLEAKVLVVGGGRIGFRKIETLLPLGAKIHLISKELEPELKILVEKGTISYEKEFIPQKLKDFVLIIVATNDVDFNKKVGSWARKNNILLNMAANPLELGNVNFPAVVKKGKLTFAVSSGGGSPALSSLLKNKLETFFAYEYELMATLMGNLRPLILSENFSQKENASIFKKILYNEELWQLLRDKKLKEAEVLIRNLLSPLKWDDNYKIW